MFFSLRSSCTYLGIINEAIKISAVPEWVKGKYVNTWYLFQVTGRYTDIK